MEYDRALYRVYERIIEDLSMSSNPMETPASSSSSPVNSPLVAIVPSSSSSVNSRGSSSLRRRRRNGQNAEEDGTQEDNDSSSVINTTNVEEEPATTGTSRNRRRRGQRRARQGRTRQQQQIPSGLHTRRAQSQTTPLPFIMPIWMAKKMDAMSNSRNNNTSSNLAASPSNTNDNGYIAGAWRNFRNLLPGIGNRSSYESVATTGQQLSIYQYSPGSSPSNHRDSNDDLGQTTPPRDVEQLYVGEEGLSLPTLEENQSSPSSRSSEGLRRRTSPTTPTRRSRSASTNSSGSPSHRSSPPNFPNSPNLSSSSSSSSSGGERAPISPPTVSLTQRAIQLQMRQARLHSRGGSSEMHTDSDNESYESDALSNDESSSNDGDESSSSTSSGDANNERNETGCSQKNVYGIMRMSFAVGIFHLFVLTSLHVTYIGPYAFRKPGMSRLSSARQRVRSLVGRLDDLRNPPSRKLAFLRNLLEDETEEGQNTAADQTLVNCISYALSTRPEDERSRYYAMFGDSDSKKRRLLSAYDDVGDDDGVIEMISEAMRTNAKRIATNRFMAEPESESESTSTDAAPVVGKDEIVQIKIMYGRKCTGQCSRVRHVDYSNTTIDDDNSTANEKIRLLDQGLRGNPFLRTKNNRRRVEEVNNDIYSSPAYWEEPHYRFSMDDALLYLDEKSAVLHNISIVNVTVTERCLSTGEDDGKLTFFSAVGEFLSQIYGMDSVIINQFMYGIRGSSGSLQTGYLQNLETKERWGWTKQQLESYDGNDSIADWILRKIGALIMSLLAFFLITTVTSLIVRVLTSSGVVLMFPLFSFFRSLGMSGADERILALSYPWIGSARTAIANRQIHPQNHLIWAHVSKILLYYVMYEACQAAWSVVLYAKSIPEALPVWIYGLAMILEYFSMVFVRSAMSAHFFPRISLLYFLAYHLYFYSVPYGFFDVALIPLFMFLMHAMLYTILAFEVSSSSSGVISVETPREVYNKLSWPEWSAQLPSEWTMFLPLNARHIPLHDRVTDEVNGTQRNDVAPAVET